MPSLPTVGASTDTWGTELNAYLSSLFLSVQDFGAVGDGLTDDTVAIQATIDAACASVATGSVVFFPAGKYIISSTLTFPSGSSGGVVLGSGNHVGDPYTGGWVRPGSQTILYWTGAAGGTMISQEGSIGWEFANLQLVGKAPAGTGNRAGIGFLCRYMLGTGSGVGIFRNVTFWDIAVACQMGEVNTDDNCADYLWERCGWTSCDTCLLVKHAQGVNFNFLSANVLFCPQFVHCEHGGSVYVNILNTSACGGTGANDWVFLFDSMDSGSGSLIVDGWRAELNTKQLVKGQYLGHVVLNGLQEVQADQNLTQFEVNGIHLAINNSRLITCDATNPTFRLAYTSAVQGAVLLNNVHFTVDTWVFNDWFEWPGLADIPIQVRNSHYGGTYGELPFPDINSHLQWGAVTHYGQTTTASSRWLSLNGDPSANAHNVCHIPVDSTWLIDAYVVGQEVGGGADVATFHRRATVKNAAGTLSVAGVQTIGVDQNTDSWGGVNLQVNSTLDNVAVDVTGKTGTTINWKAMLVGTRADAIV